MFVKILFIVFVLTLVNADQTSDEEKLLLDLVSKLDDEGFRELFDLDMDDEALMNEIKKTLGDDRSKRMADGFLSGLIGLLANDKKAEWAPINFAKQISCYQGRSTNLILASLYGHFKYNGYGCYCGPGHYQGNYLDATDRCCKYHDACYVRAMKKYRLKDGCHTYTTPYHVECCAKEKFTKCTDTGPSAGRALCECDQAMSRCVAKRSALSTYKKSNLNNRRKCKSTDRKTNIHSPWDVIMTCKHAFGGRKEFRQRIPSQGKCPAKKGFWFRKR